jgi:hypothetical protein
LFWPQHHLFLRSEQGMLHERELLAPRKSPNSEVNVEKIASRARSEVGLVAPATLDNERPLAMPAIILIASTLIYEVSCGIGF